MSNSAQLASLQCIPYRASKRIYSENSRDDGHINEIRHQEGCCPSRTQLRQRRAHAYLGHCSNSFQPNHNTHVVHYPSALRYTYGLVLVHRYLSPNTCFCCVGTYRFFMPSPQIAFARPHCICTTFTMKLLKPTLRRPPLGLPCSALPNIDAISGRAILTFRSYDRNLFCGMHGAESWLGCISACTFALAS
ncbi:hypothetical protein GMDG_05866 [Pseudogymnoascus destructans 20631-21]|uniref:Uncharacterized protein n=1 Tax=Pseudogymnoascus destructans (strain ATCC MYA-4855 / 20631-21) TaxID=658429 RepID=L8FPX3_PSED2|nr:hypothetical protein GMDG_05866 [Pseudogymnoascus destructans 20631-21]